MAKTPTEVEKLLSQNAYLEFRADWELDFAPRLKRKPSVWAKEVRVIAAGTSPLSHGQNIPYDHEVMPHLVEIMDAADDPTVRKIVMWFAIRDGKTLGVCANIIGRTVTDSPGNIYSVHPTDENAEAFSNTDIEPMIEACLQGYFVEKKSRDTGRTIEMKKFKGGWIRIFSAGSLGKFHGTSVEVLLLHELDKLNPEAIFKGFGRTTGFANAIIVLESTCTLAAEIDPTSGKKVYRSNIEEAYDQGDKRKWFCPCVKCGYLQTLKYEQIKCPAGRPDLSRYHCEACDHPHTPKEWRKLATSGKWYPTAGLTEAQESDIENNHQHAHPIDPGVRSYWRNGFNSLLPHHSSYKSKLHQFKAEGEAALNGSTKAKMTWKNEVAAELWNPESEGEAAPAWKPIFDAREQYRIIPARGLYLTAYTDCQLDRLEVGWRAWGKEEESWGMGHIVLEGHVRDREVWCKLANELLRKFPHEIGGEITLGMGLIDGGAYAEDVYRFFVMMSARLNPQHPMHLQSRDFFKGIGEDKIAKLSGHIRASKGMGKHGHPIIDRKMMTVAKNLKGHHIGTWEAKDRIYERLRIERKNKGGMGGDRRDVQKQSAPSKVSGANAENVGENTPPQEGLIHFNDSYSEDYFRQLTVEQVVITFEGGQEIRKYTNPKSQRNEALDIEVGNLAAYRLFPHNLDAIAESLKEAAEEAKGSRAAPEPERGHSGQSWALAGAKW